MNVVFAPQKPHACRMLLVTFLLVILTPCCILVCFVLNTHLLTSHYLLFYFYLFRDAVRWLAERLSAFQRKGRNSFKSVPELMVCKVQGSQLIDCAVTTAE